MRVWISICTAALLAAPAPAQAACGSRVKLENIWHRLRKLHDANGDGRITTQEFSRGAKAFGNHDRNRDGVISVGRGHRHGRCRHEGCAGLCLDGRSPGSAA